MVRRKEGRDRGESTENAEERETVWWMARIKEQVSLVLTNLYCLMKGILKNKNAEEATTKKWGWGRGGVSGETGMRKCTKMCLLSWRKQMQYLCETECMNWYGLWQQHLLGKFLRLCVNFLWGPQLLRKLLSQAQSCPLSRTFSKNKKKGLIMVMSPPNFVMVLSKPHHHPPPSDSTSFLQGWWEKNILVAYWMGVLLSVSVCRLNLA